MKNTDLPCELTYEQFKALAEQEPDMNVACVYELEYYEIADSVKPLYPKFALIRHHDKFLFRTLEEAERYMRRLASGELGEKIGTNKENIYCFHINRLPLGGPSYGGDVTWLYDRESTLLDHQYLPESVGNKEGLRDYFGRPKTRIRFHKGDIVEVNGGDEAYLAVVVSSEPDIDWCWECYGRCMRDKTFPYYILDESDFSATVVTGPDYSFHEHVNPLFMMKPRFPVTDELREYFRRCCFEPKEYDEATPRERLQMGYDIVHSLYGLDLYIHHDNDTEFPHLHLSGFDDTFLVSLRLDRPEYYPHEGNFNDRLTDRQKQLLMEELTEMECGRTRWWYILRKWNDWHDDEPRLQLPLDTSLPDYTRLP